MKTATVLNLQEIQTAAILRAAIIGVEVQIARLQDTQLAILDALAPDTADETPAPATKPRRKLSAKVRANMSRAQKLRYRKAKKAAAA